MFEKLVTDILNNATSGGGAYFLVLGILVACGLGLPLPEDVALITGGYLVYEGKATLLGMMAIAFFGILTGDSIIFFLGRTFGDKLTRRWPFRLMLTPEKRHKFDALFARYGERIVMIARFMPGVRAVTYFSAGTANMKYSHFAFFDGLAALVSAPVFVFLGYKFGENIHDLVVKIRHGQQAALGVVLAFVAVWLVYKFFKNRRERAAEAQPKLKAPIEEVVPPRAKLDQPRKEALERP